MVEKIKVGVITFWDTKENYGQILQMYALQKFLSSSGFDPFLIRYDRYSYIKNLNISKRKSRIKGVVKVIKNPFILPYTLFSIYNNKRKKKKIDKERKQHPRYFNDFVDKYVKVSDKYYYTLSELRRNPPKAKCYITGSDVVWTRSDPAFYLSFGDSNVKKIAYAASFGSNTVANREEVKSLLKSIDLITVREPQGINICSDIGRSDAKLVLDPTFLLPIECYKEIAKNKELSNNYCFIYMIGHKTIFPFNLIKNSCSKMNLKLIYSTCQRFDKYSKIYPSVEEWLGYNMNANIIITNSYHGCIYAIKFRKKFIFLPMINTDSRLNVRIETLLERLDLKDRIFNNNMNDLFVKDIDYDEVHEKLNILIKESRSIILTSLNNLNYNSL